MNKLISTKKNILCLVALPLILFVLFVIYPLINIVIMSFQETNGMGQATFIGINNFKTIFSDQAFTQANMASILLMVLAIIFNALLAVVMAIIVSGLNPKVQKFLRLSFLLPMVLSITVIAQLWLTIYHADWGLLNTILSKIGLPFLRHEWLSDPKTAIICIGVVGMWWMFGMDFMMASSGIKAISSSIYEAAEIDGATNVKVAWYITRPLLREVMKTCTIISAVGGLFTFPQVYIMTGGGPGNLTTTLMMYMYREAFSNQHFGIAVAVAVVSILECCVAIGIINLIFSEKKLKFKDAKHDRFFSKHKKSELNSIKS